MNLKIGIMRVKVSVLLAVAAIAVFLGCKKESKVVEFDIEYKKDFVLAAGSLTNNPTILSATIDSDIASKLETYNTNNDRVGTISCSAFKLAVKSPTVQNLNFIDNVIFDIKATDHSDTQLSYFYNSGSQGTRDTIKPTDKTISLRLNEPNIKNYIMEPTFDIKMKLQPHIQPSSSMTVTASFTVHAKGIEQVNK